MIETNNPKVILVNIIGGLGNQLFQFAFGTAAGATTGAKILYCVDQVEHYKLHHGLEINKAFDVDLQFATKSEIEATLGIFHPPTMRRVLEKAAGFNINVRRNAHFESKTFSWSRLKESDERAYCHGYWQSERYFQENADAIAEKLGTPIGLTTEDRKIIDEMHKYNSVAIHIRRGDYLTRKNQRVFHALQRDYYIRAINEIRKHVSNPVYYVFSDDMKIAQASLIDSEENYKFINHNRGKLSRNDLHLMSSAKHNIIANSSFSWWAAWLNRNKKKIVIAPDRWYQNPLKNTEIIPPNWRTV